MIEIGKNQPLMVVKITGFGVYLGTEQENVLLPAKYAGPEVEIGDAINVFVYRDSKDRLISTTLRPYLTLGEIAVLKVKQVSHIGAFLDWGLEKDLFLPYKEQTVKVTEGMKYPVALYLDKSNRLCATMKIYRYLKTTDIYHTGDIIEGTAYEYIEKFGMFVAVDDRFHGLIPNKALYGKIETGSRIKAIVSRVLEDGKIELALRGPAYAEIEGDSEKILRELELNGGFIPLNDKSEPQLIKERLEMSKAAFKRACGHLLKENKIDIIQDGIRRR